ncbi:type II RES/Xre toxin-antitoxin system antitoxin [Psychroflexus planctonicus]|uniref:Toxin-antitoxin system antitoxin component, TIGR02293 family n=1 Tax=Psychroflexus planctonicus TaxID=1526575 RepID=A0ABQ1SDH7_9FLAO|nr:antitoxin Xre/MbcA/ParS toxin-binding domain-containing protein [Psychroflexus planctonicus]GGE30775.1 hypothetical protein GCM10010832_09000 [Psychroflexus planctonicus]
METYNLQPNRIASKVLAPALLSSQVSHSYNVSSSTDETHPKVSEVAEPPYTLEASTASSFPKILNDDQNYFTLVMATRNGLPYKSFENAQSLMPFSSQEWAEILHISNRSLVRLKSDKKHLSRTQSEKLIEVTLLFDYGVDVFGSTEKFTQWLSRTNIALGGIVPKSLLDTNQGIKAVETALSRIEHGVLA